MGWKLGGQGPGWEDQGDQSAGGSRPSSSGGLSGPILSGGDFRGARMGLCGALLVILMSVIFQKAIFKFRPIVPTSTLSRYGNASRSVGMDDGSGVRFISSVLEDGEKIWDRLLSQQGVPYRRAKLELFRNYTTSPCYAAEPATGPFYCSKNEAIYLDLGFFDEFANRVDTPGEFTQAYVIAHELGHHIQKLLDGKRQVGRIRSYPSTPIQSQFELQADCFAGIWGHYTQRHDIIDQADMEVGMEMARSAGSDRRRTPPQGRIRPETFAHGSAVERLRWFRRGFDSGAISSCRAFADD